MTTHAHTRPPLLSFLPGDTVLATFLSSPPLDLPPVGPPGANLFIYHLPNDLTDADLATAFAPFGHVISAKVFLDKRTGESKGFGELVYFGGGGDGGGGGGVAGVGGVARVVAWASFRVFDV